jgi:hypothetical protein
MKGFPTKTLHKTTFFLPTNISYIPAQFIQIKLDFLMTALFFEKIFHVCISSNTIILNLDKSK